MTIRGKLYVAIVLTVIGPVATIAIALYGASRLSDRFDDVETQARHGAIALQLKFLVTDFNGWQTAYGYDNGRSRPRFIASTEAFRAELRQAQRALTDPAERALLNRLDVRFADFMRLDAVAYRALLAGRPERTKAIFLGPEIANFEAMARTAQALASYQERQAARTSQAFDDERTDNRRRLIVVGLGAGLVIVILLITAADIARLALDRQRTAGDAASPADAPE